MIPERPIKAAGIVLTARDLTVLRGLFESRVMALRHLARLYFDGRVEAAKKRLQKLAAAGLVKARPRQTFEPAAYGLTARGVAELARHGELPRARKGSTGNVARRLEVSPRTLRHELEVLDAVTSLVEAARAANPPRSAVFSTWPAQHEFIAEGEIVRPDGYLEFTAPHGGAVDARMSRYFIELDRSTEGLGTLAARARLYLAHLRSGGFAARCGGAGADPKAFPFRALFVVKSEARRDHLARLLWQGDRPVLSLVWIATLASVLDDPFGPIWMRPADHRDAPQVNGQAKSVLLRALESTRGYAPREA